MNWPLVFDCGATVMNEIASYQPPKPRAPKPRYRYSKTLNVWYRVREHGAWASSILRVQP